MSERRQQILETVTHLLERHAQCKITTAQIAKHLNVSEAALYRHFPSRRKIFLALYEAIDEALIPHVHRIFATNNDVLEQCQQVIYLWVAFAENNVGLAKLMEINNLDDPQLADTGRQLLARIETIIKQRLRDAEIKGSVQLNAGVDVLVDLLIQQGQGLLNNYLRSNYRYSPTAAWSRQWQILRPVFIAKHDT